MYNKFTKKLCGEVFVSGNRSYPNVIDLDHKPEVYIYIYTVCDRVCGL